MTHYTFSEWTSYSQQELEELDKLFTKLVPKYNWQYKESIISICDTIINSTVVMRCLEHDNNKSSRAEFLRLRPSVNVIYKLLKEQGCEEYFKARRNKNKFYRLLRSSDNG